MEANPHSLRAWWRSSAVDGVCWCEATVRQGFAPEAQRQYRPQATWHVPELPCRVDYWAQRAVIGPSMTPRAWPMTCSLHRPSERQRQRSSGSSCSVTRSFTSLMHRGWVSWVVRGVLPGLTRPFMSWFTGQTGTGSHPAMALGRGVPFKNGRALSVGRSGPMVVEGDHTGRRTTSWWPARWTCPGLRWEGMNWASVFRTWRWFPSQPAGEREPG